METGSSLPCLQKHTIFSCPRSRKSMVGPCRICVIIINPNFIGFLLFWTSLQLRTIPNPEIVRVTRTFCELLFKKLNYWHTSSLVTMRANWRFMVYFTCVYVCEKIKWLEFLQFYWNTFRFMGNQIRHDRIHGFLNTHSVSNATQAEQLLGVTIIRVIWIHQIRECAQKCGSIVQLSTCSFAVCHSSSRYYKLYSQEFYSKH
jgi:hypothetical protein